MRTTVRLSDNLPPETNAPAYKTKKKKFRLTTFKGTGLLLGIDPTSNSAMLDIADGLNVPG